MADYKPSPFGQMLQQIGQGLEHTGSTLAAIDDRRLRIKKMEQDMQIQDQQLKKQKSDNLVTSDAFLTKSQKELAGYTDKKDQEAYIAQKLPSINASRQAAGLPPLTAQDVAGGGEGMGRQRAVYADKYAHTIQVLNDPSVDEGKKLEAITDLQTSLSDNSSAFTDEVLKTKGEALKTLSEDYRDRRNQKQLLEAQSARDASAEQRQQNALEGAEKRAQISADARAKADEAKATKEKTSEQKKDARLTNYQIGQNTVVKKFQEQNMSLATVNELADYAKKGNTVAGAALGIKMAKAMGEVGVMTEQDIKRYITSGKLDQKAGDKLAQWTQGKPSDATLDEIKQIAAVIGEQSASAILPIVNTYIDRYANSNEMTREEAAEDLGYTEFLGGKSNKTPTTSDGKTKFVFKPKK